MRSDSLPLDSLASPRWLLLVGAILLLCACQPPPLSPADRFKKEVKSILDKLCTTPVEWGDLFGQGACNSLK